jgi:hypothetical protein
MNSKYSEYMYECKMYRTQWGEGEKLSDIN